MKNIELYDKENDILYLNWGGKVKESAELFDGNIILDFDKNYGIIGIEILGFISEIRKSADRIKSIMKKKPKK